MQPRAVPEPLLAEPDPDAAELLAAPPLPEDVDHPGRRHDPAPMRALVEQVLRRLDLPARAAWEEELAAVWGQVVPAQVAAGVRPGKWEQGVLYLFVADNTRLFEIQRFHLRGIEAGLRKHFDAARLKQVRVMIDPDARPKR
jgi:hypothetical protein